MVCSGASCDATFVDAVFDGCSLLVLSAAQATLSKAAFKNMEASQSGLGVLVHGVSSRVVVQGGTVAGGTQAVEVQAGGHLEATGLTVTGVGAVGAGVQGEGSCLSFTGCEMYDFSEQFAEDESEDEFTDYEAEEAVRSLGVHVHSSGSTHLSSLSVLGSHGSGVGVASSASATLDDCTLSQGGTWLFVTGSCAVHATKCRFRKNDNGAVAQHGATLTAVSCTSFENRFSGFESVRQSRVFLTDCSSHIDGFGCVVSLKGVLSATRVAVTNAHGGDQGPCVALGFDAWAGGHMLLTDCSVESCYGGGVHAFGDGAKVVVEGCRLKQNGASGVMAEQHALVVVKDCHSSQHSTAGYQATGWGWMYVSSSVSEGDKEACSADEGGQLTMEEVNVDGTLQSGQLP